MRTLTLDQINVNLELDLFPQIGNPVNPQKLHRLAMYFNIKHIARRIEYHGFEAFKTFKFDGISVLPDDFLIPGVVGDFEDSKLVTYGCGLPHDIWYAAGHQGDGKQEERATADTEFYQALLHYKTYRHFAAKFHHIVKKYGDCFGLPFAWGYAWKNKRGGI